MFQTIKKGFVKSRSWQVLQLLDRVLWHYCEFGERPCMLDGCPTCGDFRRAYDYQKEAV